MRGKSDRFFAVSAERMQFPRLGNSLSSMGKVPPSIGLWMREADRVHPISEIVSYPLLLVTERDG